MYTLDRDATLDVFRDAILKALDEAARQTFEANPTPMGASDADLPRLFKALDEQVDVLANRYGVILTRSEI